MTVGVPEINKNTWGLTYVKKPQLVQTPEKEEEGLTPKTPSTGKISPRQSKLLETASQTQDLSGKKQDANVWDKPRSQAALERHGKHPKAKIPFKMQDRKTGKVEEVPESANVQKKPRWGKGARTHVTGQQGKDYLDSHRTAPKADENLKRVKELQDRLNPKHPKHSGTASQDLKDYRDTHQSKYEQSIPKKEHQGYSGTYKEPTREEYETETESGRKDVEAQQQRREESQAKQEKRGQKKQEVIATERAKIRHAEYHKTLTGRAAKQWKSKTPEEKEEYIKRNPKGSNVSRRQSKKAWEVWLEKSPKLITNVDSKTGSPKKTGKLPSRGKKSKPKAKPSVSASENRSNEKLWQLHQEYLENAKKPKTEGKITDDTKTYPDTEVGAGGALPRLSTRHDRRIDPDDPKAKEHIKERSEDPIPKIQAKREYKQRKIDRKRGHSTNWDSKKIIQRKHPKGKQDPEIVPKTSKERKLQIGGETRSHPNTKRQGLELRSANPEAGVKPWKGANLGQSRIHADEVVEDLSLPTGKKIGPSSKKELEYSRQKSLETKIKNFKLKLNIQKMI